MQSSKTSHRYGKNQINSILNNLIKYQLHLWKSVLETSFFILKLRKFYGLTRTLRSIEVWFEAWSTLTRFRIQNPFSIRSTMKTWIFLRSWWDWVWNAFSFLIDDRTCGWSSVSHRKWSKLRNNGGTKSIGDFNMHQLHARSSVLKS